MTAKLDLTRAFSEHNVTSKTVAERIGLPLQIISSYVHGTPSVSNLYRIEEALDNDVRDLFYPITENDVSINVPEGSLSGITYNIPQSKAIITYPHCGETLITALSPFPKSEIH